MSGPEPGNQDGAGIKSFWDGLSGFVKALGGGIGVAAIITALVAAGVIPIGSDETTTTINGNGATSTTSQATTAPSNPDTTTTTTEPPPNSTKVTQASDVDGDGFAVGLDCDDTNAAINPDANEIPDNQVDENCDGSLGMSCQLKDERIPLSPERFWLLTTFSSNWEFDGNGPDVLSEVWTYWDVESFQMQVYMQAIETKWDWTQASGRSPLSTPFTAPSGYKIVAVKSDGVSIPSTGTGSNAADFGISDGRGGKRDDTNGIPFKSDVYVAASWQYRDTDHAVDRFPDSGLVAMWEFVGDTDGTDVGNDKENQDANVTVTFNDLILTIEETGDCIPPS